MPNLPSFCAEPRRLLLLWTELWRTNITSSQLDAQNSLHISQDLLIRGGGATLEIGYNRWGSVALGGEVLLRELWLHLLAAIGDGTTDNLADCVWLDNVVGSIDLGQMLTFTTSGLRTLLAFCPMMWGWWGAYRVANTELLLL
jgi:hypothetical protein